MSVCCEVMLDLCIDVSGIDRASDEALYGTFSPLRLSNDIMHLLQTLTQRIVSIFLCFIYFFLSGVWFIVTVVLFVHVRL